MMKAIRLLLPLLLAVAVALPACTLDIPTENELTDPKVVTSIQTAYEALSSAYAAYPTNHYLLSLLADDFAPLSKARMVQEQMSLYHWEPFQLEKVADQIWCEYYHCIVHLNALLTRLPALQEQLREEELPQLQILQAEAETLKATCYLELLQLFATRYDAPERDGIILKEQVEAEQLPRSTKEVTLQEIEHLLLSAQSLFETAKGVTPIHQHHHAFISPQATAMLLARLFLYQKEYKKAVQYAKTVLQEYPIDSSLFLTQPKEWLSPNSKQILFSKAISSTFYTESFIASFKLEDLAFMLNPHIALSPADLRHGSYTTDSLLPANGTVGSTLPLLGKYNLANLHQEEILYVPLIRSAEALFIYMEAKARLGQEAEAKRLLNDYLSSLGVPAEIDGLTGEALLDFILKEKHKEFAGENLRFFDLKRTDQHREILGLNGKSQNLFIEADDYRWTLPIPHSEYQTNRVIGRQNPGWRPLNRVKTN